MGESPNAQEIIKEINSLKHDVERYEKMKARIEKTLWF